MEINVINNYLWWGCYRRSYWGWSFFDYFVVLRTRSSWGFVFRRSRLFDWWWKGTTDREWTILVVFQVFPLFFATALIGFSRISSFEFGLWLGRFFPWYSILGIWWLDSFRLRESHLWRVFRVGWWSGRRGDRCRWRRRGWRWWWELLGSRRWVCVFFWSGFYGDLVQFRRFLRMRLTLIDHHEVFICP